MFKSIVNILFLSIFSLPILQATTYYVDASVADESGDGLSPATAFKSLVQVSGSTHQPGDVYLFKRGEIWQGNHWYINYSGDDDNEITFGAYGNPTDPLPVISGLIEINAWSNTASWTQMNPNHWVMNLTNPPGRLIIDGQEVLRASIQDSLGQPDNENAVGKWFYNYTNQELHIWSSQNPATLYSSMIGSKAFYTTIFQGTKNIIVENIEFRGGSGASVVLFGAAKMKFENCKFGKLANSGMLITDVEVDGHFRPSSYIEVNNNTFDSEFTFYYGLGSERGCGDGVRLTKGAAHCDVFNNNFLNWAHNAIELLGVHPTSNGVNNNRFFDNYITAPDIPYAHPLGADGILNKCRDNEFFRNTIENCRTASQINGNNNWVHHNIMKGMRNSPCKPAEPTAHAFILGVYGTGFVSQENRFDYNLIIDTDEAAFLLSGYGIAGQVKFNRFTNNIMLNTGQSPRGNVYQIGTAIVFNDASNNGVGENKFLHNVIYNSSINDAYLFYKSSGNYHTVSQLNNLVTLEEVTFLNNLGVDPLLQDFMNGNYQPTAGSPVIDAGIKVELLEDFFMNPRIMGAASDIGPIESN